jgi:hypothetical protein
MTCSNAWAIQSHPQADANASASRKIRQDSETVILSPDLKLDADQGVRQIDR